jgi:YbbR domain-containing protein
MGWLLRNWALKLGAVALATVLYTGLVYSGSFAEDVARSIPVRPVDQPSTYVNIGPPFRTVDIRYRIERSQARPTVDSFSASIDLSKYDTQRPGEPQLLPIKVSALGQGINVLSFTPTQVSVTLDTLDTKMVPVVVDRGSVPDGLEIGTPRVTPDDVQVKGASSRLGQVVRAVANVSIDASGISVDREFDLVPVDVDGQRVESVELTPNSVHIGIDVTAVQTNKTVPVRPTINGTPASGSEIGAVSVDPPTVTLQGAPDVLSAITEVATEPVDIAGVAKTTKCERALRIPDDATLVDGTPDSVNITLTMRAATESRTFATGIVCRGASPGTACLPQLDRVAVTLSGPVSVLDGLDPADFTPFVDVSGLAPGTHSVQPTLALPDGVKLVGISPTRVRVLLEAPPTPEATASPSPTA